MQQNEAEEKFKLFVNFRKVKNESEIAHLKYTYYIHSYLYIIYQ